MPELAEVSGLVARLKPHLLAQPIVAATAMYHANVYVDLTAERLESFLKGKMTKDIKRWGKYFWLEFEGSKEALLLHLGMNGWMDIEGEDRKAPPGHFATAKTEPGETQSQAETQTQTQTPSETQQSTDSGAWPPKFTLFTISTATHNLAFTDSRKLAKIRILDLPEDKTPLDVAPLSDNGPDVFLAPMPAEKWEETFKKRQTTVKTILMDQGFASGLGNWMCDEVCLAARIHPLRRAPTLSQEEIGKLLAAIKDVCEKSVAVHGQASLFPDEWLFHVRWGRKKDNLKLKTGEDVKFLEGEGRATAYVPVFQGEVEVENGKGKKRKSKAEATPKKGKATPKKKAKTQESEDEDDFSDSPAPKPKAKAATKATPKKKAAPVKKETPPSTSKHFPTASTDTPSKRARKPPVQAPPTPSELASSDEHDEKPAKRGKKTVDSDDYEEPEDDDYSEGYEDKDDGDFGEEPSDSGSDYGGKRKKKKLKPMKPKVVGTRQSARRRG